MKQFRTKIPALLCYLAAAALVGVDQLTKVLVRTHIALGERVTLLPGVLGLTYVQNTGMAFSAFSGYTWALALLSLVVAVAIAAVMWTDYFKGTAPMLMLGVMLGGTVGNLIDRAFVGYVTDMIEVLFFTFPVFNVADCCICVSVVLLLVWILFFDGNGAQRAGRPR